MQGLIGKKIGMTQIWDENGVAVPVTVVEVGPCPVVQVKTVEKDGYVAAQLGFEEQKDPLPGGVPHGGKDPRHAFPVVRQGGDIRGIHAHWCRRWESMLSTSN